MRVNINEQLTRANSLRNSFLRWLVTFLAVAVTVSAQQKTLSQEKRLEIEKAVSSFMSANSVPGIGAAVVLEGEPVWSAGFGMADLEDSAPAPPLPFCSFGSAANWTWTPPSRNIAPHFPRKNRRLLRANCSATWVASAITTATEKGTFPTTAPATFRAWKNPCKFSRPIP